MIAPRSVALGVLLAAACSSDPTGVNIPRLGTTHVLYGAAGGGRSLTPLDIKIVRATDLETLEVPGFGNVDVDMIFAGIDPADLPAGVAPDQIVFARATDEGVRALPPLTNPHVLRAPTPPGTAGELVPVAGNRDLQERLDGLIAELRITDPCTAPTRAFTVDFQRSRASRIDVGRPLSNGETYFGLAATSTSIAGRVPLGGGTIAEEGIDLGVVPLMDNETARVVAFGVAEITDSQQRVRPTEIGLLRGGILGHVAVWSSTLSAYRDDTPRELELQPRDIAGFERVDLDGVSSLCMFGSVVGLESQGVAAVWCRADGDRAWTVEGRFDEARRISALIVGNRLLAVDIRGAVHERTGAGQWREIARAGPNQGCDPICVGLFVVALDRSGSADFDLAMAGDNATLGLLRGAATGAPRIDPLPALATALFADERGGDDAIDFSAATVAPDGGLWLGLGKDAGFVIRVSPSGADAERVCLPEDAEGAAVTSFVAHTGGDLVIGLSPPRIAVGTWQRP